MGQRAISRLWWVVALAAAGCGGDDGDGPAPAGTQGSTAGGSAGDTAAVATGTTGAAEAGSSSGGATTDPMPASTSGADSSGSGPVVEPPDPLYCGLADLDPEADPAAVLDAGDGVGQIPTVIGDALIRNCGCHYTENVPPPHIDYMSNTVLMETHADFHVPFTGSLPQNFDGPVYLAVYERVINARPIPMPTFMCDVMDEEGVITQADYDLFEDWLDAGAPDGASYPPR